MSGSDRDEPQEQEQLERKQKQPASDVRDNMLPLILCGLTMPASIMLWLSNVLFSRISNDYHVITPLRWLISLLLPLLLMLYGLRRRGINTSGACFGLLFAIILSIASHPFLASLAAFFFSSSRATRFRARLKRRLEVDFRGGEGRRNWVQVLCNGGMPTQLALLYLLDCGSGERPIDFVREYRASWLAIGILAALACSNGDTWASELGSVLGGEQPRLITSGRRVPRGTNGAVTGVGLLVSLLGGVFVGAAYWLCLWATVTRQQWAHSPAQWPLVVAGGMAGLFGSVLDSVLGATVQYSGETADGRIVEQPGERVRYISGRRFLGNHSVNLLASIGTALAVPMLAVEWWPQRH